MHHITWGLFLTDRWVVAPWENPPPGATWATKYQGRSERSAWEVASIWNEKRRKGLEKQAEVRARSRRSPRVSFCKKKSDGTIAEADKRGSLPAASSDAVGYQDHERVAQGLIMPGIGPSKGPHVDTDSAGASAVLNGPPPGHVEPPAPPPPSPGLHAAFAKAQSEFAPVKFNARNAHFKNPYATLDAMLAAVRPALNRHGIGLTQHVYYEGEWVSITTELWHEGSVYRFPTLTGQTREEHPTPQNQAAAATYLKRQALAANLGVAGEADDDGNLASLPEETTAEKGTDSPRSSARKAAKPSKAAPAPAAGPSSGEQGAGGVLSVVGTVASSVEGKSKKGNAFWKVTLTPESGGEQITAFVWDAELGAYIESGQIVQMDYEPGDYPKVVGWIHHRDDGTTYIPGMGEVGF
jgi:hypothetical protein